MAAVALPQSVQHMPRFGAPEARLSLLDRSDVLIVTPASTSATRLLVERARRAGVPIIAESISYPGAIVVVAIDDYRAGVELAHWVGSYAQRHMVDEVRALDLTTTLPNTAARSRGFAEGLRQVLPNGRILLSVDGGGLRDQARQMVIDVLAVHPEINVIFAINDDSAQGALDAYRAAGLDERKLLVVAFGLEGAASRRLLQEGGPFKAGVAMFPEAVGRACIDAVLCAYHNCAMPGRIMTPFAVVTGDTLEQYYRWEPQTGVSLINWAAVEQLPSANAGFGLLGDCGGRSRPARIGWVQVFSSHDWYRNIRRTMQDYSRSLGIQLEVLDASQDVEQEVEAFKRAIGCAAARFVSDGDTIILDAGATTTYLARGSARAARYHGHHEFAAGPHRTGRPARDHAGVERRRIRTESRSLTGPGAEATFRDLRADKAFIAGTGLSLDFGLSNTNIAEASVKQAMLRAAGEVALLADHTKIGAESLVRVAPLESIHRLITDTGISPHDRLALTQRGIEVTIAEENPGKWT